MVDCLLTGIQSWYVPITLITRALILFIQTLALYKSFTYLLAYLPNQLGQLSLPPLRGR